MLHDSVLRCLITVRHLGKTAAMVLTAVREGESFLIVLEWGSLPGEEEGPARRPVLPDRGQFDPQHVENHRHGKEVLSQFEIVNNSRSIRLKVAARKH